MFDRCRRCLGMGYKGRESRGRWIIGNCPRCGGNGVDLRPETLPENKAERRPDLRTAPVRGAKGGAS